MPTLRLKLIATTLSGGFMGMAGAPLPYYVTYLDPASGFSLNYAVNAIAMPLIGGTASWLGPVIGAVLVGGLQEYLRVTISSAVNVLVAGVLMVAFVILAPAGHRRPVPEEEAMTALLQVAGLGKRFGGFVALDGDRPRGAAGRAARPDRAQRLGQVDAGQLHLRHAAQRDRAACASPARRSTA